ncbi:MAG: hypothetical protein PHW76_04560 [Alphaproteobacteria bacterium]|nr:hypothetical protein [Alphaproteobacteria bacterium]
MNTSHQIQNIEGVLRIDYQGYFYAEDELREAIWLANIELRNGLPKGERIEAECQIVQYERLLNALRGVAT